MNTNEYYLYDKQIYYDNDIKMINDIYCICNDEFVFLKDNKSVLYKIDMNNDKYIINIKSKYNL